MYKYLLPDTVNVSFLLGMVHECLGAFHSSLPVFSSQLLCVLVKDKYFFFSPQFCFLTAHLQQAT